MVISLCPKNCEKIITKPFLEKMNCLKIFPELAKKVAEKFVANSNFIIQCPN